MTNKPDALPVVAECNCPKIGERFNPQKSSGACPTHDRRDAELAELRDSKERWQKLSHQKHEQLTEAQAELTTLRARLAELDAVLRKCMCTFDNCTGMGNQTVRVNWYANHLVPTADAVRAALSNEAAPVPVPSQVITNAEYSAEQESQDYADWLVESEPEEPTITIPRELLFRLFAGNANPMQLRDARDEARKLYSSPSQVAPRPTGLSHGWNLVRQQDGFVIGHSQEEPTEQRKQEALKENRVYVPFLVADGVVQVPCEPDAVDRAIDWLDCQQLAESEAVDDALQIFSADSTLDNATALVIAVRTALLATSQEGDSK